MHSYFSRNITRTGRRGLEASASRLLCLQPAPKQVHSLAVRSVLISTTSQIAVPAIAKPQNTCLVTITWQLYSHSIIISYAKTTFTSKKSGNRVRRREKPERCGDSHAQPPSASSFMLILKFKFYTLIKEWYFPKT